MSRKKTIENPVEELEKAFARWDYIYEYGANDPCWEDGCNLNLVRNHIAYYKRKIADQFPPDQRPAAFLRADPPEVNNKYMARPKEIREHARAALAFLEQDENYQYLKNNAARLERINSIEAKRACISNVVGYVDSLRRAIKMDDLVRMRQFENPKGYVYSFRSCAENAKKIQPPGQYQLSLFDTAIDCQEEAGEEPCMNL